MEVSFPVFAGFVSPLLSGLSVYLWLGACIIPAILLLILAVFKMQGTAAAQANAGPSEQAAANTGSAPANAAPVESVSLPTEEESAASLDAATADMSASLAGVMGAAAPRSGFPSAPAVAPSAAGAGSQEPAESAPAPNASGQTALDARCAALANRHGLTPRESEVLRLLAAGNSQRKIADVLVVSLSSAQTYSKNVYRKLGVHSRQEVIDLVSQDD